MEYTKLERVTIVHEGGAYSYAFYLHSAGGTRLPVSNEVAGRAWIDRNAKIEKFTTMENHDTRVRPVRKWEHLANK